MKRIIACGIMILSIMSCVKETVSEPEFRQKTLTANVENNNATKVGFTDGDAKFFWTKGDIIGVTTTTSSTSFSLMTLDESDAGKASGTFNGDIGGDPQGFAVYPYISEKHKISENSLTYYLPEEYTYEVLDNTYANAEGNSHNAPMWGAINGNTVSFKHLGGVIAFEVNGLPADTEYLTFKLTANKKINGEFTSNLSDPEPKIITSDTEAYNEKSISIRFSTAEEQTSGYIYIPVPTGDIGDLSVKVYNASEEIISANWDNITISRKDIRRAIIENKTIVGGTTSEVDSANDVTEELEKVEQGTTNVTVEVKNEVTGDNDIIIPKTLETETTTIKFNAINDDANITITNENTGNYSGQVIIEILEGETIPTIEADIPGGEVYIKQGKVTNLIVASAYNTTIIGSGVTVSNLTVKKGNVKIEKGGSVTAIDRENNTDSKTYVYMAEGVERPEIKDENIVAMYMSEEAILVSTAEQLKDAVEYGGQIMLTADITIAEKLVIGKSVLINGNDNTLTYTGNDRAITVENTADGADLSINYLTVNCTANYCQRGINYNTTGKLTLDNVTVTGTNVTYALNLPGSSNNAIVTITECDLSGNIALNVWGSECTINVTDSNLTAIDNNSSEGYAAVMLNNDGVTSAENSIINIIGGKIEVTGTEAADTEAVSNGTGTGHINISDTTTVLNGETVDMVAVIRYGENSYSFDTLAEAVEFAKDGETVILIRDVTLSEILVINKAITLDGNGKKLTSTAGRAINVSGADGVTIKNLTIDAKGERAINIIQNATNVTIDNVTATSANYTVNVAGSAPNAVVNIKNSTLNGLCTVNVAAENANVTVDNSTVNCNDNDTTPGEDYAALCLGKESIGGKIIATNTVVNVAEGSDSTKGRNGAENGTVTINGSTEDVAVMVAVITYPSPQYHSFTSIKGAIEFAQENDVITLIRDITINELIAINKAITLDLNGKTVTATSKKAFEVYNNATIKNGSIVAAERCVDTRTNVALTLTDVALTADSNGKNTQPLTIGGNTDGTTVTMTNVEINAGTSGYGIITFVKTSLTATNSNISGYSSLYVKPESANSEFNFMSSKLSGSIGTNDVIGNEFGTLAVRANDVTVNVDAQSIVSATGNNYYAMDFTSESIKEEQGKTEINIKIEGTITGSILPRSEELKGNKVMVKSEYVEQFSEEDGYNVVYDANGLITITASDPK